MLTEIEVYGSHDTRDKVSVVLVDWFGAYLKFQSCRLFKGSAGHQMLIVFTRRYLYLMKFKTFHLCYKLPEGSIDSRWRPLTVTF